MNVLAVIDMQNDFITGVLGTREAEAIVERVAEKICDAREAGWRIVFTRDTHHEDYLQTQEGRNLPVPHCIFGTDGWQIASALDSSGCLIFDKPSFGSPELIRYLSVLPELEQVQFVGLCTDICVITNALMLKGALAELPISVDSACCAGVTPQSHDTALAAMSACQIRIV